MHARLASGTPLTVAVRGISDVAQGATIRLAADQRFIHVFDERGTVLPPVRALARGLFRAALKQVWALTRKRSPSPAQLRRARKTSVGRAPATAIGGLH